MSIAGAGVVVSSVAGSGATTGSAGAGDGSGAGAVVASTDALAPRDDRVLSTAPCLLPHGEDRGVGCELAVHD